MSDVTTVAPTQTAEIVATDVQPAHKPFIEYTSIVGNDVEARMRVLQAISDAEAISEHFGEDILVQDLIIQNTQITDKETGEVSDSQRTTLITPDGKAYSATSVGIINSMKNLLAAMGEPSTWGGPIIVNVTEQGPKGRRWYKAAFSLPKTDGTSSKK